MKLNLPPFRLGNPVLMPGRLSADATDAGEQDMPAEEFRFYFGCASGSSRKALRKMEEPNVMISFATANNTPFKTIDDLFIDSGGYSAIQDTGEYDASDAAYLNYLADHAPERYVLRDYPCEPDLLWQLGRTVGEHQQRTTQHHRQLLAVHEQRGLAAEPVAVLQGWTPEQYLSHLDDLRDAGVLTPTVAIGSVCRRHETTTVSTIIHRIRDALGSRHDLHAFGVKTSVLRVPGVVDALDSADSTAYDFRARMQDAQSTWREQVYHYLCMKREIEAIRARGTGQRSLHQYAS